MRYLKRTGKVLLALLCAVVLVTAELAPAVAVSQADIDALKGDASDLKQQKKDLQNKISALSDDISNTMKKKELLDSQTQEAGRYQPEEAERLNNAVFATYGTCVVLCVTSDTDTANAVIKEYVGLVRAMNGGSGAEAARCCF